MVFVFHQITVQSSGFYKMKYFFHTMEMIQVQKVDKQMEIGNLQNGTILSAGTVCSNQLILI